MPTTVEEIQAIVRDRQRARGPAVDARPGPQQRLRRARPRASSGSVIVSLRNMNRVLEINEELGYAVVEPGVRWFDLYEAIEAGGHELMLSIADLGWGSVVGNTLDHGAHLPALRRGLRRRSAAWRSSCADGDAHAHRHGRDGGQQGLALLQARPRPDARPDVHAVQLRHRHEDGRLADARARGRTCRSGCGSRSDDDIAPLVDTLRTLMLDGTIRMVPQIMNVAAARRGALRARGEWYDGDGADARRGRSSGWREELGLRPLDRCASRSTATRPSSTTASRRSRTAFEAAIPGAEVWGTKYDAASRSPDLEHPSRARPGRRPEPRLNTMTGWYGGEEGGHIGFSPVAPLTGRRRAARSATSCATTMEEAAAWTTSPRIIPINARSFVHVTMVLFDTQGRGAVRDGLRRVHARSCVEAAKRGYGEYRAHLDFMDLATEQYGFNDHALPALQRDDQGRARPQRDPLARQAGHLARAHAQRRALASEGWLSSSTPPSCPRRSGSTSGTRCRCGSSSRSSSRRPRARSPAAWSTTASGRSACGT